MVFSKKTDKRDMINMNTLPGFLLILACFVSIKSSADVEVRTPTQTKQLLGFFEGNYKRIKGNSDFCQGELVQLHYEPVDSQLTLVLGQSFTFSRLLSDQFEPEADESCTYTVTNKVDEGRVVQNRDKKGTDPKKNRTRVSKLERFNGVSKIRYEYVVKSGSKNLQAPRVCEFEFVSRGEKK